MKSFFCTVLLFFAVFSPAVFAADERSAQDTGMDPADQTAGKSIASIREEAEKGSPEAQYTLALHYEKMGDMTEAFKWYRMAADQGDFESEYKVGVCYEKGQGVSENSEEAFKWYKKAAEKEFAAAQLPLGLCYENGVGVKKDIPEAIKWYRKLANHGNAVAQYRLGFCYEKYGEVQNYDLAAMWYRKSAERGNAEAQLKLAELYEKGKGVEKNMNEAVNWYSKAAAQGNLDAQLRLGGYYSKVDSKGKPVDMAAAIRWYAKAVDQGYQDADLFNTIGSYYRKTKRDMTEAVKWYQQAAELGSVEAEETLEKYAEDLQREEDAQIYGEEEAGRKSREETRRKEEEARQKEETARKATERLAKTMSVTMSDGKAIISFPDGVKLEMIKVEAGTFNMSSDGWESNPYQKPHQATLTRDFYLGRTEITQAQWLCVMGKNPSYFQGKNLPVNNISWYDAMSFCEKLNSSGIAPDGWKFTLPTETQWEYAARGGKKSEGYKYSGSNNLDSVAWHYNNARDKVHPVGQKLANELGLYDMSGNVWELCLDRWENDTSRLESTRRISIGEELRSERGCGCLNYEFYNNRGPIPRGKQQGRKMIKADLASIDTGFRLALVPAR